jgi:hypothetical protein
VPPPGDWLGRVGQRRDVSRRWVRCGALHPRQLPIQIVEGACELARLDLQPAGVAGGATDLLKYPAELLCAAQAVGWCVGRLGDRLKDLRDARSATQQIENRPSLAVPVAVALLGSAAPLGCSPVGLFLDDGARVQPT